MGNKIPSEVREIILNGATYKGTSTKVIPTYVNFFFGNNGSGKSTIAEALKAGTDIKYASGKKTADYLMLVYNQAFIDANFRSFRNMKGVFTINEKNIEVQGKIEEKTEQQTKLRTALNNVSEELSGKRIRQEELRKEFYKDCSNRMENWRKQYPKTLDKRLIPRTFTEAIIASAPKKADPQEIKRFYDSAFSSSAKRYDLFSEVGDESVLDTIPDRDLLSQNIINSSNTELAKFLEGIGATEWVRKGHAEYAHKAGTRCPYCGETLKKDFEEELKKSFDTQYTDSIEKLKFFLQAYTDKANNLFVRLQKIPAEIYPEIEIKPYNDKLAEIKTSIQLNLEIIKGKIAEPGNSVVLSDLQPSLSELSVLIDGFNEMIKANNEIVDAGPKKQKECVDMLFAHMAYLLQDVKTAYDNSDKEIADEIKKLESIELSHQGELKKLKQELADLHSQTVETVSAMNSINTMLRDSGFQGFHLEPHETEENVYKVVRENGDIADTLSEGEKNFIAFLFFYHLVKGSQSAEGESREKIVVIDDPVSSMDSNALFIVSAIVREMIEVCRNNADNRKMTASGKYIKQIFILTHNAYFHREITYDYVTKYEYVSFYLIRKQNNISSIKLCERKNPDAPSEKININPVKNSYAALWDEYKELQSGVPLMNVIRQILEYYFIQLCGYPGADLREAILKKENFQLPDGSEDTEHFQLAEAMLSYIGASSIAMADGLNYIDDCIDPIECRAMFENIFRWMKQGQHFDKMMGIN